MATTARCLGLILAIVLSPESSVPSPPTTTRFERVVIDADFPGGYQVEVADVNGDGKPDVVALGGSTLAWYENPTWKKRVISTAKETPDIISSATADLDGDGKAEIAVAYDFSMNEPKRGKLLLAIQGANPDDPWRFVPIVHTPYTGGSGGGGGFAGGGSGPYDIAAMTRSRKPGEEPSSHRLRWGWIIDEPRNTGNSITFEKGLQLVVAPIFGPSAKPPGFQEEPAHLLLYRTAPDPKSGRWYATGIGDAPVIHAIEVISRNGDQPATILVASNLGVTSYEIGPRSGGVHPGAPKKLASGAPGVAPKKGASEVHRGKLKGGKGFVATVEPWHGSDVAIYDDGSQARTVIDSTLKEGHALWVADVDGDGDDEVFAGYRGGEGGVLMYDFDGKAWARSVLDPAVTAQDLRGGDLDGDGTPDVVAIGGKTHNVVWYRPIRPKE